MPLSVHFLLCSLIRLIIEQTPSKHLQCAQFCYNTEIIKVSRLNAGFEEMSKWKGEKEMPQFQ